MSQSKVNPQTVSILTLEPGLYNLCSCGLSNHLPFCDAIDQGQDCRPVSFELTESKQIIVKSHENRNYNITSYDNRSTDILAISDLW